MLPIARFAPLAAAATLVAFAALPATRSGSAAVCPSPESFATADTFTFVTTSAGVRQPFDGSANVAACSLAVAYPYYSHGGLSVLAWDPLALAPDAATIALWTRHYDPSQLHWSHVGATFDGALVVSAVGGVAERPRTSLALEYVGRDPYNPQCVYYDADAPPGVPLAQAFSPNGIGYAPLAGPRPALGTSFCPATGALADERVLQSVMTTSQAWTAPPWQFAQRFRVPVRGELHRVQLAFAVNSSYVYTAGVLDVYDAAGQASPPAAWGTPLAHTTFLNYLQWVPAWAGHYPLDQYVTLEPGHDYWLVVTTVNQIPMYGRTLTGGEGPDFTAGVGELYARATSGGAWESEAGRVLSFQMIGRPDPAALAVAPSVAARLRVEVEPNPATGVALVRWSGAPGVARVEVHDVRGRRVRTASASGGQWLWDGAGDDGAPLPAGVYFVRVGGRSGPAAVTRLVRIR